MNWLPKVIAILFLIGGILVLSRCTSGGKDFRSKNLPTLTLLDSSTYNFGKVSEGEPVEHAFKFKNTGKYPLILARISSSCGCTTPEWPKEPIMPDSSSIIKVKFDTKGKSGPQLKTVTVFANTTPEYVELRVTGFVDPVATSESTELR
jgi:hypothetical protein